MAKYSPQTEWFSIITKLKKVNSILFYVIFITSILTPFIKDLPNLITILNIILIISIIFSSSIRYTIQFYLFPRAEEVKRNDFFDNSYGKKYNIKSSEDYFTNEKIKKGNYKLLVNLFENSLFTCEVSSKMKIKKLFTFLPYVIILILISFWGFNNNFLAIPFLQLFLSVNIIGDLLTLFVFSNRNERIFNEIKNLFERMDGRDLTEEYLPEIINVYSSYESNINWASIQLDSKIFHQINPEISTKWEEIKKRYNIGAI